MLEKKNFRWLYAPNVLEIARDGYATEAMTSRYHITGNFHAHGILSRETFAYTAHITSPRSSHADPPLKIMAQSAHLNGKLSSHALSPPRDWI